MGVAEEADDGGVGGQFETTTDLLGERTEGARAGAQGGTAWGMGCREELAGCLAEALDLTLDGLAQNWICHLWGPSRQLERKLIVLRSLFFFFFFFVDYYLVWSSG